MREVEATREVDTKTEPLLRRKGVGRALLKGKREEEANRGKGRWGGEEGAGGSGCDSKPSESSITHKGIEKMAFAQKQEK
jgi:hypothetical protein